jgi:hypothetical protein
VSIAAQDRSVIDMRGPRDACRIEDPLRYRYLTPNPSP